MNRHVQSIRGQLFEIDVVSFPASLSGELAPLFVATVCRLDCGRSVPFAAELGRREIYGPTEDWAVRNACDCVVSFLRRHQKSEEPRRDNQRESAAVQ